RLFRSGSAKGMRAAVRLIVGQKPRETRRSLTLWTEGTRAFFGSMASWAGWGLALAVMAAKSRDRLQVHTDIGAPAMKLDGSIAAVVTGGASGLGEGTASALAAKGVKVALFDLNEERGEAIAKEIGGVFCKVDVTDDASVA